MKERVKLFTYTSGTGSTIIQPSLEDHINDWLNRLHGQVVRVTQSESERPGAGPHVTICIWYVPDDPSQPA
jgi:hypothetical protein